MVDICIYETSTVLIHHNSRNLTSLVSLLHFLYKIIFMDAIKDFIVFVTYFSQVQ